MIDCGSMRNNKSHKTISSITALSLLISTVVLPSYAGIEGGVHARFDHELNGSLQNINAKGINNKSQPTAAPLSHAQQVPGGSTNVGMTHVLLIGPGSREVTSPRSSDTMAKSTGTQNRSSDDAAKSTDQTKAQIQNKALDDAPGLEQEKQIGQNNQENNKALLSGWQTTLKDTASSNIAKLEGEKDQLSTSLSTHTLNPSNFSKLQTWAKNNKITYTIPYNPYQEGPIAIITIGKFTVPVYGVSVTGAFIFTAVHDYIPTYLQSHEQEIALKSLLLASPAAGLGLRSSGLGLALKTSLENPVASKADAEPQVFKQPVIFAPSATSDDGTLNFEAIENELANFTAGESASLQAKAQAGTDELKEQASSVKGQASALKSGAQPLLTSAAKSLLITMETSALSLRSKAPSNGASSEKVLQTKDQAKTQVQNKVLETQAKVNVDNGASSTLQNIKSSLQQTASQIKQSQTTVGQFVHGADADGMANSDATTPTTSTTDKNGSVNFTSIENNIAKFENGESTSLKTQGQAAVSAIKEQASATKGEASALKSGAQPLLTGAAGDFGVSIANTPIQIEKEQLQSSKAQEPPEKTPSGQREEEKELLATQVKSQIKSPVNVTNKSTSDMETAREYTLGTGSAFVANDKPMTVHTSVADITVPAKNGVFIVSVGDNVAVYNLTGGGAATVGIGSDKVIPLKHSDQLVLTKNTTANFDDINPGKDIKSQNVRDIGNYSGVRVFGADFNYESVLDNLPQLSTLLTSTNGHEQSIGQRLLKTTAVQEALDSSN